MLGFDVSRLFTLDLVGMSCSHVHLTSSGFFNHCMVLIFRLCTSPPPCLGLLKRSEGLINEVNFSERTDQCVLISFVRFGSVRKRRLTCQICSLIICLFINCHFG